MLEIVNQLDGFDSRGNIKARPCARLFTGTHLRVAVSPYSPDGWEGLHLLVYYHSG